MLSPKHPTVVRQIGQTDPQTSFHRDLVGGREPGSPSGCLGFKEPGLFHTMVSQCSIVLFLFDKLYHS